jgi:hypothetical protein
MPCCRLKVHVAEEELSDAGLFSPRPRLHRVSGDRLCWANMLKAWDPILQSHGQKVVSCK